MDTLTDASLGLPTEKSSLYAAISGEPDREPLEDEVLLLR
jgi:hypothetical protein